MSNIFSNRFFQGSIAAAVIGIAFYAYKNSAGDTNVADSEVATTEISNEASIATTTVTSGEEIEVNQDNVIEDNKTENTVNNTPTTDNINTAVEETTDNQ